MFWSVVLVDRAVSWRGCDSNTFTADLTDVLSISPLSFPGLCFGCDFVCLLLLLRLLLRLLLWLLLLLLRRGWLGRLSGWLMVNRELAIRHQEQERLWQVAARYELGLGLYWVHDGWLSLSGAGAVELCCSALVLVVVGVFQVWFFIALSAFFGVSCWCCCWCSGGAIDDVGAEGEKEGEREREREREC